MKMMIKVEITKGFSRYFYETQETIVKCPKCKSEYKTRKYCLHCSKKYKRDIATKEHIKIHTGVITRDLKKFSCDCIFGAWFRWGKHWRDNYPESRCKHCKWAMKEIEGEKNGMRM